MASKSKAETKAAERAARLAELEKQKKAQERKRNLMVGGVVGVVLVLVAAAIAFAVTRGSDVADGIQAGDSDYGLTIGDPDAPRQVVIYEDFLCPICGQLEADTNQQLADMAEAGDVYVDYRPFNLFEGDPYSIESVSAFGAVLQESGPEVAKKFHDELFADQPAEGDTAQYPDTDWFVQKAVEAGADEATIRPLIEAGENDFARGATAEAVDNGITGTPTVIVDGKPLTNWNTLLDELES
ncbi:thioredoxin domain-containing protein [Nocardioides sp. C4-1]|uniref:DsbA family protein n=1 Tax=Nocardioides sp. C4-1 TaxID=3151851 RepID=UPI0032634BE9